VGEEVKEREEDREGLLHAQEAVEGPFPMELDDILPRGNPLVSYDVLAGVVALCGTCPEEELMEKSYKKSDDR